MTDDTLTTAAAAGTLHATVGAPGLRVRDLKPGDRLCGPSGTPYVVDHLDEDDTHVVVISEYPTHRLSDQLSLMDCQLVGWTRNK